MSGEPMRCALDGCAEPIEQSADGGPRRLYCSAAHRAAARKQRQVARTSTETEAGAVVTAATAPVAGTPAPAAVPAGASSEAVPAVAPEAVPGPAEDGAEHGGTARPQPDAVA